MISWLDNTTTMGSVYFYIALFFSIIFVVQTILTFVGMGDSFELDADFDGEVDVDVDASEFLGLPFHLFSIRGIIGFFMMFGWVGYSMETSKINSVLTFIVAFLVGCLMLLIIGLIYYFVEKLGESGNVDLRTSVGKTGEVYLPIPANRTGHGKVHITLNESLREIDAVTDGELIRSGEEVKVVEVLNNLLIVTKKKK